MNAIVDELAKLPEVGECYELWWRLQCQVENFYSERERVRPPLSQVKEFRAIKSAFIREAKHNRRGAGWSGRRRKTMPQRGRLLDSVRQRR